MKMWLYATAMYCVCTQSCLTLCNPTDCSPPSSFVLGIFQAGIPLSNRRYYKGFTGFGCIKEKIQPCRSRNTCNLSKRPSNRFTWRLRSLIERDCLELIVLRRGIPSRRGEQENSEDREGPERYLNVSRWRLLSNMVWSVWVRELRGSSGLGLYSPMVWLAM